MKIKEDWEMACLLEWWYSQLAWWLARQTWRYKSVMQSRIIVTSVDFFSSRSFLFHFLYPLLDFLKKVPAANLYFSETYSLSRVEAAFESFKSIFESTQKLLPNSSFFSRCLLRANLNPYVGSEKQLDFNPSSTLKMLKTFHEAVVSIYFPQSHQRR
jgi:hypothetical protein